MSSPEFAEQRRRYDAPEEARTTDLRTILGAIRRNAWVIVLAIAICAGGAYALSNSQKKKYSASASVLLRAPSALPTPFIDPSNTPDRDAATNFEIASQGVVRNLTADSLARSGDKTGAKLVDNISLSIEGNSDVLKVSAEAPHPAEAARVANAFANQYIAFRQRNDRKSILNAQSLVTAQLASQRAQLQSNNLSTTDRQRIRSEIASLRNRQTDLGTLAALQTGNASIIEDATAPPADKPSSPKPKRDALIGAFAGLLLGLALVLGRDQLDRRVRRSEEVEELMDLPLFGRIRRSDSLAKPFRMPDDLPLMDAEAFRMLRANLRYSQALGNKRVKSVMVTSAAMEDGKSTVGFYLAAVAAARGSRVLLIEADMRRPVYGNKLGLPGKNGLSTVLASGHRSMWRYCHQVPVAQHDDSSPRLTMDVMLAGKQPRNAAELLDSPRMVSLLESAVHEYDLVVIDTPPVAMVSDAIPLMSQVDAVLVVARVGRITGEEMNRLRDQLDKVGAPTVGIVANYVPMQEGGYYAYGQRDSAERGLVGATNGRA